jgi:hypothetical protein
MVLPSIASIWSNFGKTMCYAIEGGGLHGSAFRCVTRAGHVMRNLSLRNKAKSTTILVNLKERTHWDPVERIMPNFPAGMRGY